MTINGKEINFEYTIGAYCDFMDYCAEHPDVSMARASVYKAIFMNKAYVSLHGGETITVEEIMKLPHTEILMLIDAVKAAEAAGEKRSVETKDVKKKDNRKL